MNLPSLGEKVLKEKRRKVQETLDRVMKLYQKEDPELYVEMKTFQIDYEKKRKEKQVRLSWKLDGCRSRQFEYNGREGFVGR